MKVESDVTTRDLLLVIGSISLGSIKGIIRSVLGIAPRVPML